MRQQFCTSETEIAWKSRWKMTNFLCAQKMENPDKKNSRVKRGKSDRLVRSFADGFPESDALMAGKTHLQDRNYRLTEAERVESATACHANSDRNSSERQPTSTAINQRNFGAVSNQKSARARLCDPFLRNKFSILLLLTLCSVSKGKQHNCPAISHQVLL